MVEVFAIITDKKLCSTEKYYTCPMCSYEYLEETEIYCSECGSKLIWETGKKVEDQSMEFKREDSAFIAISTMQSFTFFTKRMFDEKSINIETFKSSMKLKLKHLVRYSTIRRHQVVYDDTVWGLNNPSAFGKIVDVLLEVGATIYYFKIDLREDMESCCTCLNNIAGNNIFNVQFKG